MIDAIVMTDGRADCIAQAIPSLEAMVAGIDGRRVIHDDSGDAAYRAWLKVNFPGWAVIGTEQRLGFTGAYANAWQYALTRLCGEFLFQTEDDFTFNRRVHLPEMADVLMAHPHLAQLALRRQPWNENERAAGGVVEQYPDAYTDCYDSILDAEWLEHRIFYTTNPSLLRRALVAHGWPSQERSEGMLTHQLRVHGLPWGVSGEDTRFAFWGARDSGEWVTHIGHQRVGTGY